MQASRLLYSAETGQSDGRRILRWVNVFTFGVILLVIGGVIWGALASGHPAANYFVRVTVLAMMFSVGVFGLLFSISRFGWWGSVMLLPLGVIGLFWLAGGEMRTLFGFWGDLFFRGGGQILKFGFYALAGITGLGLLAQLMEKVGVTRFFATLVITTGIFLWAVG